MRLTETHRPADDDADGCALSDADLAILAAPPERYAEYVAAVRREYAHVPDAAFRAGRAAILRDLLAKPHLFHTAYAREHWEATARANVQPRARPLIASRREVATSESEAVPGRGTATRAAQTRHFGGDPPRALAAAQAGGVQPADQLAGGDRLGAERRRPGRTTRTGTS